MKMLKKFLAIVFVFNICICSTYIINAEPTGKITSRDEVEQFVISDMVFAGIISNDDVEAGLVEVVDSNDGIALCSEEMSDGGSSIIIKDEDDDSMISQVVVPMMKDDKGDLVNAIDYLSSVATSRTFDHNVGEINYCTMNVKVVYDYYYSRDNDYQYPYYQHGTLSVKFIYDKVEYAPITNLKVTYVSQGFVANANGYTNGVWSNTVTRINRSSVITNTTYSATSASNGRLFFMRDASEPLSGQIACSGIGYSFMENGVVKTGAIPIIYDQNVDYDYAGYLTMQQIWEY
ncbi:MAG: hypothetical protein NC086_02690 [Alistipes sp.]|nr:hypothetical protein [Alistipes sp.]